MTTNYDNISGRAVLVALRVTTWQARRFDRAASDKVNADAGAERNASRVNKHLLAGSAAHKAVMAAAMGARNVHYAQTLPWSDEGFRLLPTKNYLRYQETMRTARREFLDAVDALVSVYPALREEAPKRLGALFDAKDFPAEGELRQRFDMSTEFSPVPRGNGDLRIELPDEEIAAIRRQVVSRVTAAAREAQRDAYRRLHEAVGRIKRATVEGGIVRSTLVEHVTDVVDTLTNLNIAEDTDLEALRTRVRDELTGLAVEDLRKDDLLRDDTQRRASAILDAMAPFYTAPKEGV